MRSLRAILAATTTIGLLALAGACGGKPAGPGSTNVALEPINSATNPFMPPAGADQANVTAPAGAGGTVAGNTAGLYGGSLSQSSCDPAKMVAYLRAHTDKAAAWAGVLGIQPGDIPTYVSELTPAVLRADTYVINHGFVNGQATAIPAVLQAGTAVLVDAYGFPVTKCFCGNPLLRPTAFARIVYTGTAWPSFAATSVTIIQSTTVVINQFTLVDPATGKAFDRPRGTDGRRDGPPTQPTPPPPSGAGPPPSAATPSASTPSAASPSTSPGAGFAPPAPATPTTTPPTTTAPTTTAPTTTAPTTTSPPALRGAPPPGASTTPATPVTASWIVGDCYADRSGMLHATVLVRNNDPSRPHSYQVTVAFPGHGSVSTSLPGVGPGETASAEVLKSASGVPPGTSVSCEITRIVDETGKQPPQGPPIPPPPDTRPEPAPTETTPTEPSEPGQPSQPGPGPGIIPAPSAPVEPPTEAPTSIPAPEPS